MKTGQPTISNVIRDHRESGRFFHVNGTRSFALEVGQGPAVLCLHGVPTSSFLYRKVIRALGGKGCRGISFDFPGLGLAERPQNFDYSFRGLLNFALGAIEELGLSSFHLVVHDIGGPIGFALAGCLKSRIQSITILNTWIDVANFSKPLPMRPFSIPLLGELELATVTYITWYMMFSLMGVCDMRGISKSEVYAYVTLLKREDHGRAFLRIMRNFDYTTEFRNACLQGVQNVHYPIQVIWGKKDPGLTLGRYGTEIKELIDPDDFYVIDSKHLVPEDQHEFIAEKIVRLAKVRVA